MKLGMLLEGVTVSKMFQTMFGKMVTTHEVEINGLRTDSRAVTRGDMFIALSGTSVDGHRYIGQAIRQGAKAIVVERDDAISDPECMHTGTVKIVVPHTRRALASLAANYHGRPAVSMKVVGVTGTNGKTTTAHLVRSILEAGGERAGFIGTTGVRFGSVSKPASHTTPEPLELQSLFARMKSEQCTAVSMEVSSHALEQSRVDSIPFECAVFTNLTQDHLDYHGTIERYADAKKILFDGLSSSARAVINADDPWSAHIAGKTRAHAIPFGESPDAFVKLKNAEVGIDGSRLEIEIENHSVSVSTPLVGRFNVSNVLAAFATGIAMGVRIPAIELGIASVDNVKGRLERVVSKKGWTAIIDYAHTPDALEKCLNAVRELVPKGSRGKIITVFGAGGDRDRGKRPLMGEVVARLSDRVIVTSDNPRSEKPDDIINDILSGIAGGRIVERESDRRKAISMAVSMAHPGDIILIAGKGHEEVQVIGGDKLRFSDRDEVEALT